MSQLPVLIIGAGPAGLNLANGLTKLNIPFHVFERDQDVSIRAQGYRVRLGGEGPSALQHNLSPEIWALFGRTCGEFWGHGANVNPLTCEEPPSSGEFERRIPAGKAYTVDRTTLRNVLLTGLDKGSVTFGKEFKNYEVTQLSVIAHFTDGSSVSGSLLVGAEGARSRVRKQYLPNLIPLDTEGCLIFGRTPITTEFEKAFLTRAFTGTCFLNDNTQNPGLGLLLEHIRFNRSVAEEISFELPEDYMYWVLIARRDYFTQRGMCNGRFARYNGPEAADLTLELTSHWHKSITALFKHQNNAHTSTIEIISMHPEVPEWTPSRVTLLGDAAHVMPPTGGVGAVSALQDGAELCKEIEKNGVGLVSIGAYEKAMRQRAREYLKMSLMGGKHMMNMKDYDEMKPAHI